MISEEQYQALLEKERLIAAEMERLKNTSVGANKEIQDFLVAHESSTLKTAATMAELMCRPELSYEILGEIDGKRKEFALQICGRESLPADVIEQVEIEIKYEGYIAISLSHVESMRKLEKKTLSMDMDYREIKGLRLEAQEKLNKIKPLSVGQASRISGVNPADISVLLIWLEQNGGK